jgi:hypothetical protein
MDYLVEFVESGGARIIKDPLLIDRKKDSPNVLLNPDIRHLRGVSPSFWIKEGDSIVARSSEETQKMVLESIDEVHPFATAVDAPFSQSSKFIAKIEEIDARQDEQIKNLSTKIMFHHDDMYSKLRELKLELDMKDHLHEAQIKSMKKIGAVLYFSCILAMLLLKFF